MIKLSPGLEPFGLERGKRNGEDLPVSPKSSDSGMITSLDQLPLLLSVPIMAATGAASERQLRKLLEAGTLNGVRIGTDWRVPKSAFCKFFHLD